VLDGSQYGILATDAFGSYITSPSHAATQVSCFEEAHFRKEIRTMLHSFFCREDGQGLVEYALILMLIVMVVLGILTAVGVQISEGFYEEIVSGMDDAMN
jgi:pilus assembly protein Flp/PilA